MSERELTDDERRAELQARLAHQVHALRLTPDELAGSCYRLTVGRVLYLALGVGLFIALPLAVLAEDGPVLGLAIGAMLWLICWGAVQNMREALCEHIVGHWCTRHSISTLQWISQREALAPQLPRHVRWAARHLGAGRSV